MISPPFAAPQDFKDALHPPDSEEGVWFIFSKDQLLISEDRKILPIHHDFILQRTLYLGTASNKHLFAAEVESENTPPAGWHWSHLKPLHAVLDPLRGKPRPLGRGQERQQRNWIFG